MQSLVSHNTRILPIILLSVIITLGQAKAPEAAGSMQGTPKQADRRIMVESLSGSKTIGLLIGARDDTLLVFAKGRQQSIPFDSLFKVTLSRERKSGSIVPGMLVGTYLGGVLLRRDERQPPAFVRDSDNLLLVSAIMTPFFAAGVGIFDYLFRQVQGHEDYRFVLRQPGKVHEPELERLKRAVTGRARERRAHLSINSSLIFTQVRDQYDALFQDLGYKSESWYYGYGREPGPFHKVNLLRKVQLTYLVTEALGIGVAYVSLSEPTVRVDRYEEIYSSIIQSLEVPSYFAVVTHEIPTPGARLGSIHLGFCLGAADIDFGLEAGRGGIYEDHVEIKGHATATQFSSMMFCEWRIPLAKGFSIGIIGDYVYTAPMEIPAMPDFNIPAQTLQLGNASIGVSLGLDL
jgi:hypothetical protein